MPNSPARSGLRLFQTSREQAQDLDSLVDPTSRPAVLIRETEHSSVLGEARLPRHDPLLTAEDVAERLNVTKDWVWDHSSRKHPFLPVIRMSDGTLRYRASRIEDFIDERERLTQLRRKRG